MDTHPVTGFVALPSVTVLIVNYNGRDHLERLLPTLMATRYPSFDVRIADNASSDGSVAWLAQSYPQIPVLARANNDGFAKAVNELWRNVRTDAAVFLNPDVVCPPDWLSRLVHAAYSRNEIGIAAALPLHADEWDLSYEPPRDLAPTVAVSTVSGAAMLIKRHVWETIGLLDEAMFLYWEDTEYCWRAILSGFEVVYAPSAFVLHELGGSARRSPNRARLEFEKAKNELYTRGKILGPGSGRRRARYFRLRCLLKPWKNRHLWQAAQWYRENLRLVAAEHAKLAGAFFRERLAAWERYRLQEAELSRRMSAHLVEARAKAIRPRRGTD